MEPNRLQQPFWWTLRVFPQRESEPVHAPPPVIKIGRLRNIVAFFPADVGCWTGFHEQLAIAFRIWLKQSQAEKRGQGAREELLNVPK